MLKLLLRPQRCAPDRTGQRFCRLPSWIWGAASQHGEGRDLKGGYGKRRRGREGQKDGRGGKKGIGKVTSLFSIISECPRDCEERRITRPTAAALLQHMHRCQVYQLSLFVSACMWSQKEMTRIKKSIWQSHHCHLRRNECSRPAHLLIGGRIVRRWMSIITRLWCCTGGVFDVNVCSSQHTCEKFLFFQSLWALNQ